MGVDLDVLVSSLGYLGIKQILMEALLGNKKHKVHGVISSRWLKLLLVGLMVYKVGSLSHEARSKEMLSSYREPTRIARVVFRL